MSEYLTRACFASPFEQPLLSRLGVFPDAGIIGLAFGPVDIRDRGGVRGAFGVFLVALGLVASGSQKHRLFLIAIHAGSASSQRDG